MATKKPTFDEAIAEINKTYGAHTMLWAGEAKALEHDLFVPTGMPIVDAVCGGGVPLSRVTILEGENSGGKTLLCLKFVSAFQRFCRNNLMPFVRWDEATQSGHALGTPLPQEVKPMRCVWVDTEHTFSNVFAAKLGVDVSKLKLVRPHYAEQACDIITALIETGECDLIVLDSIAALAPSIEVESSTEDKQRGALASLMTKCFKVWTAHENEGSLHRRHQTTILCTNHIKTGMGAQGISYKTTPGGKAPPYFATIRLEVKKKGFVTLDNGLTIGHDMEIHCTKNKIAPPNRTGGLKIHTVTTANTVAGASNIGAQLVTLGELWGVINKAGNWYELAKGVKANGLDAAGAELETPARATLREALANAIAQKELAFRL